MRSRDFILDDLEHHRRWVATEGREGAMASWPGEAIEGVDLTGAMLAGALLVETTFVRGNIVAADFSRAVAGGAAFVGASAAGAKFVKAQLESSVFEGSDLRAATFLKAELGGASLKGCHLAGATFDDARCVGANFAGAQLRAASLVRTDFSGVDLAGADLADARLVETRFDQETRLDGVVGLERCFIESILVGSRASRRTPARPGCAPRRRGPPGPLPTWKHGWSPRCPAGSRRCSPRSVSTRRG